MAVTKSRSGNWNVGLEREDWNVGLEREDWNVRTGT